MGDRIEPKSVIEFIRNMQDISNLHYLLKSPFRYPPLSHGSRFGRTNEPSIFYGAASVRTTLFEIAYYRFLFIHSIEGTTPDESISSQHTIFSIHYRSNNGVQLQNPPFNAHAEKLRDSVNYIYTQELGSAMRNADVDVFEYESARDPDRGICIGLFNSSPFIGEQPNEMSAWFCEVSLTIVAFKRMDSRDVFSFPVEYFLVNNELPIPAN